MITFLKIVETGRVRMNPALPVSTICRGVASEKFSEQDPCDISQEYTNYDCNPSVNFLFNQVIITFLSEPRLAHIYHYTQEIGGQSN